MISNMILTLFFFNVIVNLSNAGWGTNERMIISILAHRNATQRSFIRAVYAANYNKDLLKELDRELSGDFEVLI